MRKRLPAAMAGSVAGIVGGCNSGRRSPRFVGQLIISRDAPAYTFKSLKLGCVRSSAHPALLRPPCAAHCPPTRPRLGPCLTTTRSSQPARETQGPLNHTRNPARHTGVFRSPTKPRGGGAWEQSAVSRGAGDKSWTRSRMMLWMAPPSRTFVFPHSFFMI